VDVQEPEAALKAADRIAEAIVQGEVHPAAGARRIWTEIWSASSSDLPDLAVFVNDATDWEEMPERRQEIEGHIRKAAARFLAR
jgi:hypothetical protein